MAKALSLPSKVSMNGDVNECEQVGRETGTEKKSQRPVSRFERLKEDFSWEGTIVFSATPYAFRLLFGEAHRRYFCFL